MEDNFKNLMFAFILFTLFGMAILTVVISGGTTYSKDTSDVVGGSLALSNFNDSVSSFEARAEELKTTFNEGSVWSAIAGVVVEGIFGIAKDMFGMILAPFDLLSDILNDIFNIPSWATSVLLVLLIFSVIFSIWRLIKIGD